MRNPGVLPHTIVALLLASTVASASSHREAPGIAGDPTADNTDVYAFVSPDRPGSVTILATYVPTEEPGGGPNFFGFDDAVLYDIHIDNNGDCQPDISYRFDFSTAVQNPGTFLYNTGPITSLTDTDWNIRQTYSLTRSDGPATSIVGMNLPCPPANIGPVSTPNYATLSLGAVQSFPDGTRVFAGQRDDPFFVDLGAIFDLLTIRPGAPGNLGGGRDGLGGFNCQLVALQVPTSLLTRDGSTPTASDDPAAVIGVWATASRPATRILRTDGQPPDFSGPLVQLSRLGMPLVNEIVIPLGDKDRWNGSVPSADGQFLSYVTNPEPAALLNALYGISVPPTPRNDLVAVFLTGVGGLNQPPNVVGCEEMRLNVAIPPATTENRMGVLGGDLAGFPNGRRLKDDIVDIELQAVAGVLVPGFNIFPNNALGDGVDTNDLPCLTAFPYVGTPHHGFDHPHHRNEPPRPVPVTLATFTIEAEGDALRLNWHTTEESNVVGFRVERNSETITPQLIPAHGSAGGSYTLIDRPGADGLQRYALVEVARDGREIMLGVREFNYRPSMGVAGLALAPSFPNPTRAAATIPFTLSRSGDVTLSFFDAAGRLVERSTMAALAAGTYEHALDASDWPAGVYFYRLETGDESVSRALRVVR